MKKSNEPDQSVVISDVRMTVLLGGERVDLTGVRGGPGMRMVAVDWKRPVEASDQRRLKMFADSLVAAFGIIEQTFRHGNQSQAPRKRTNRKPRSVHA